MGIEKINIKNFTVFKDLEIEFSEGINIFIGENGTGKTHMLKFLYSINRFQNEQDDTELQQKILIKDFFGVKKGIELFRDKEINQSELHYCLDGDKSIFLIVSQKESKQLVSERKSSKTINNIEIVFIPAKDMLTHSKGFPEMKEKYGNNMPFDKTLIDIIKKSKQWKVESMSEMAKKTTPILEKIMDGVVVIEKDTFYIQKNNGDMINFSVEAEGIKKIGLLWQLLMNENITKGSILIWDEPEANLNPKIIPDLVEILLELSRNGVQIFIATHDYILAKYFDVRRKENDNILFHSLFKTDEGVKASESQTFKDLNPNPIVESFDDLMGEIYSNLKGD